MQIEKPFAIQIQTFARGAENFEVRAATQQFDNQICRRRRRREEMLEIVENEQRGIFLCARKMFKQLFLGFDGSGK